MSKESWWTFDFRYLAETCCMDSYISLLQFVVSANSRKYFISLYFSRLLYGVLYILHPDFAFIAKGAKAFVSHCTGSAKEVKACYFINPCSLQRFSFIFTF